MHISSVAALWPERMVRSLLSPTLVYVHCQVISPVLKWWKSGAAQRRSPGCSQSRLSKIIVEPSATFVATVCLCECVDICQMFASIAGHVAVTVMLTAPGGMLMSLL